MPARVQQFYPALQSRVDRSLAFVQEVSHFRRQTSGNWRIIPRAYVQLVAELSFLRIFLAWEDFLEETFIRYMCGARSASGYAPVLVAQYSSIDRARRVIQGSRPYADWAHPKLVIERAELYFHDGEPYRSALRAGMVGLNEMLTIRNRIAHRSPHATAQFRELVLHELGHNPQGMGPGRFLLTMVPLAQSESFIQHYGHLVIAVANTILNPAIP